MCEGCQRWKHFQILSSFFLKREGWWLGWLIARPFGVLAHHSCVLAQLKVKTPHKSGCLSLQMRAERIAHLVSPWDDDGVRQHVCGSLSQTQTHSELAAVMEMRWALFSNVRAMEPKQWCHHWPHAKQEQPLFRISNGSRWLLMQQAYRSI